MSLLSPKSFRIKNKEKDSTPESSDSPRKRTNTLSRLFRRRSGSFSSHNSDHKPDSLRLSGMKQSRSRNSLDTAGAAKSPAKMNKSISVPNRLDDELGRRGSILLNGNAIELAKYPTLPSMKPIKPQKTKLQELDAVRRKLIGAESSHLPHLLPKKTKDTDTTNTSTMDEEDDEDINTDSDEFKQPILVTTDTNKQPELKRKKVHRPVSSTPNPSDDEYTNEHNTTLNRTHEASGLLSTLMHTFNFKSFTDLSQTKQDEKYTQDEDTKPISHALSSTSYDNEGSIKSDVLDSVSFVPVKKSLISSLGEGSLTIDAFPKNQTNLPIEDEENVMFGRDTSKSNLLNVSLPHQINSYVLPENGDNTNGKARRSKSMLSRKTIKSSLSSTFSDEEEGNNISTMPMSHTMSFKKKLKLPLSSKRQSLDNSINSISLTPDETLDVNQRKDVLFDKLEIKAPGDKRQDYFHQLFPNLPADEILIDDYTCAYRKDLLIHGKLYLSSHYISFHSNIIGLVTHLSIPLNSILKMQKKKTLGIPNAIEFSNLHNKYIFATFISRDQVYGLIYKVWRINCISSNSLEVELDEEELDSVDSVSIGTSDEDEEGGESDPSDKRLSYSLSKEPTENTSETSISDAENMVKDDGEDVDGIGAATATDDNTFNGIPMEGPKTHAPTSHGYTLESGETKITDEIIKAPMGVVYSLLFGDDVTFLKNLLKIQKNYDIGIIPKFTNDKRVYRYVKPVNGGPVGPKQTKCIVEETVEKKDFDKYCLVVQSTESPDVPSGNSFKVRTKIFLNWVANNSTQLYIVTTVVWSGKSWIKGAIEKGAISGQKEALGILVAELRKKIITGSAPVDTKGKKKAKKSKGKALEEFIQPEVEEVEEVAPPPEKSYMDIIMEQLDLKFILIFILFIIVISDKFKTRNNKGGYELYSDDRMLMSESSLWEWIEQREKVSMNISGPDALKFKYSLTEKAKHKMTERELRDTIQMMEQQVAALKEKACIDGRIL